MAKQQSTNGSAQHGRRNSELAMLRLAAIAIDLRGMLTPREISRMPTLERALVALDDLFRECYDDVYRSGEPRPARGKVPAR